MSEGIAYQNKDILFKMLGETYKNKSFSAYGIDLPPIKALLPTNLPQIAANEKSTDNLFLLEDGTYAIVDYESEFKKTNKIKYINYIARVMSKYLREDEDFNLRLIIIYTGDVQNATATLETACFTLRTEQAFLVHIDGTAELEFIREKISLGQTLTDAELMKLIILPLTIPGLEGKHEMLEHVVDLAEQLPDTEQKVFALSGAIVASDKFIKQEYKEQIRRRINMTWLSEMYEKEKIEYANQKVKENSIREKNEMAKSLLDDGVEIIKIMKATGLSEEELMLMKEGASVPV